MPSLLLLHVLAALVAPMLVRAVGRRAFIVLAAVPASAAVWALTQTSAVYSGAPPTSTVTWVPALNLELVFRLDALSWIMTLIVGGVGALVLLYCAAYFSTKAKAQGPFAAMFVAFAGAMLGLVTTDNTLVLYVFWELTTIFSFLLIGHYHRRQASRRAAFQAIIVTTAGGLAMLAGVVAFGQMPGGSYSLTELVRAGTAGELGMGDGISHLLLPSAIALVLAGAVTKSALVPFHFWLPAAMAAPTPVSAYLHAAAMVKAGVYLVARLAPGLGHEPLWHWTTLILGLATMLVGGYRALKQHDLKLVLAFGTVSQLGMMIALVGYPDKGVALAGLAIVVAHAVFKACLFLVVGVVDWATGTRDLRELSGLGKAMPAVAAAGAIGVASMMGLPPLAGYVAKEGALESLVHAENWAVLAVFALGSVLTVAYGLRFWFGAFSNRPGMEPTETKKVPFLLQFSPIVLAVASILIGLFPGAWESRLAPHADQYPGHEGHLTLWGGFGLALAITITVLALGALMFVKRNQVERIQDHLLEAPSADAAYRRSIRALEDIAADVTAATQRGSLPAYLGTVLAVTILTAGTAGLLAGPWPEEYRWVDSGIQFAIVVFICVTAVLAARARRRLKAALLLGASGYGMAMLFASHGAPDLALTQVMVETISLVLFVLVLRRLPTYFSNRPLHSSRYLRMLAGVGAGAMVAVLGLVALSNRVATPVSQYFAESAYQYGYGRNVVNVLLVDIRAWDTMGEISVLFVAATGVASLLFLRDRTGIVDPARNRLSSQPKKSVWDDGAIDYSRALREGALPQDRVMNTTGTLHEWLRGGSTLSPRRRSIIFEIGVRLIFHSMLIFSLYLLFAGHNQPGGGFAGGLMAGSALVVRYLAGGRYELGEALPLHAGYLLGGGLAIATLSALLPLLFGGSVLQTVVFDFHLPIWGDVHLATALLFDVGVYVLVVGLAVDVLRSLGAEIDRHGELEGIDPDTDETGPGLPPENSPRPDGQEARP